MGSYNQLQRIFNCLKTGAARLSWAETLISALCPDLLPRSSIQSLSHVRLFVTPRTAARQASLSITNSLSLLKLISIESVMPSNHLILCCPLLLLPSIFPSIRAFSNESVLCIKWPNYWSFSFGINPSNEYSGLISFRMDLFDLLAGQGILKSLHHHSSKASMPWCPACFMVQVSHPGQCGRATVAAAPDFILVEVDVKCPCIADNADLYRGQASQETEETLAWGSKVTTERDGACARNSEKHTAPGRGRLLWTLLQAEGAECGCRSSGTAEPAVAGDRVLGDEGLAQWPEHSKGIKRDPSRLCGGEEAVRNPEASSQISFSQAHLRGYALWPNGLHPPETANGLDLRAESALSQKWRLINFCLLRKARLLN